jgi:hypothetical protein
MKEIPLTQGKVALVDDEDYEFLIQWKWYVQFDGWNWYALRNSETVDGRRTGIKMHRVIMNAPEGLEVDHEDHNGLNNQKKNLRVCAHGKHMLGKRKYCSGVTSRFKGVSWRKENCRWRARLTLGGKLVCLGDFEVEEDAARAYDAAARRLFKDFAYPNFPVDSPRISAPLTDGELREPTLGSCPVSPCRGQARRCEIDFGGIRAWHQVL